MKKDVLGKMGSVKGQADKIVKKVLKGDCEKCDETQDRAGKIVDKML